MQNIYQCPKCSSVLKVDEERILCQGCGSEFDVKNDIAFLLDEKQLGWSDKKLRDTFYDGVLGKFYQRLMPLLSVPARPFNISKVDWLLFASVWMLMIASSFFIIQWSLLDAAWGVHTLMSFVAILFLSLFFIRQPHFFHLLWTAIPTKISLERDKYQYKKSFATLHQEVQNEIKQKEGKLRILDISTGTGNALLRHGWTKLNADVFGFDLSETMLRQLQNVASANNIPLNLVLGDACHLPFADESFDVVTNYGAINGYTDIKSALSEMCRVMKPGGRGVFLDEQLYAKASWVEKQYFSKVLSSHNLIHHCPSDLLPPEIQEVEVHQIYEFYYLCIFKKPMNEGIIQA